ncbi:LrgB family protein [Nitrogeniibacter mangrovi]|uniref:LrgB family protein n=1 Tax=Nitrogeniibacter mangrovi TaxID=2016596 RepID=A0A6C1B0U0_9RHOO|nr:LrgB family protein [Nitrogeniibacter mangrovi]QID17187.1 LrgB family protein [Nitrogeniibacter mangrovi]
MNQDSVSGLWVYLSARPLLGLTMTLVAYGIAWRIHQRFKSHPLANPVLIAVLLLVTVLTLTHTPYQRYFDGAQFVHFLLGPATVALAIPLYGQLQRLRRLALPLGVTLLIGSAIAIASAWAVGAWLGADEQTLISLAPKSVTTPIAMAVAEALGGLPSLTAALVIATGILGAMTAQGVFHLLRIRDAAAQGFAIGIAAHGIGTARAFQLSPEAGAFSALAMAANGLLTAVLVPWLIPWLKALFAAH